MTEMKETANVLGAIRMSNLAYLLMTFGDKHSFKREPFVLVEDHIYRGLEHQGHKTLSFCQLGTFWQAVTQTIFGVAKYGLVGMRGGVTVAPAYDVEVLRELFESRNSDLSPFAVLSCEYMLGDNKNDKRSREKFLKKKTLEYERNATITAAIIDGKARDFLNPVEYEMASGWLTKYGGLAEEEAHKLLEDGIRGINVVNMPHAGFFLLLSYEGLVQFSDDETSFDSEHIYRFIREAADTPIIDEYWRFRIYGTERRFQLGHPFYCCAFSRRACRKSAAVARPERFHGKSRSHKFRQCAGRQQPFRPPARS